MSGVTTIQIKKTDQAKLKRLAKNNRVSAKGIIAYVINALADGEITIDWDEVRADNPSQGERWKRVKESIKATYEGGVKNRADLYKKCERKGFSRKQVDAVLKILEIEI